jgi:hypothetical protein
MQVPKDTEHKQRHKELQMFYQINSSRKALFSASLVLLCALGLGACGGSQGTTTPVATPQGTVELNQIKVGMPEATFRDAVITFVPDPLGSTGGKTQYLSRTIDANGGQYIVQCKDGRCFQIQVTLNPPAPKDKAAQIMKDLIPADAPAETKVEQSADKVGKAEYAVETHLLGTDYRGQLISPDKGQTVSMVNTWYLPAAAATPAPAQTSSTTTTKTQ